MCGIALVVSGCRLDLSSLHVDARASSPHPVHEDVNILGLAVFFSFVIIWIYCCGANSNLALNTCFVILD